MSYATSDFFVFHKSIERQRKNINIVDKQLENGEISKILSKLKLKLIVNKFGKRISIVISNLIGKENNSLLEYQQINEPLILLDKYENWLKFLKCYKQFGLEELDKYKNWLNFLKCYKQFGLEELDKIMIKSFITSDSFLGKFLLNYLGKKYLDHYKYWCSILYEAYEDKLN